MKFSVIKQKGLSAINIVTWELIKKGLQHIIFLYKNEFEVVIREFPKYLPYLAVREIASCLAYVPYLHPSPSTDHLPSLPHISSLTIDALETISDTHHGLTFFAANHSLSTAIIQSLFKVGTALIDHSVLFHKGLTLLQ